MPAATKSTSFLHLATIGYLLIEVQGIRAVVMLSSKPFHASAKVIFLPLPIPSPMNLYLPMHLQDD
jgi:hypothetical protein